MCSTPTRQKRDGDHSLNWVHGSLNCIMYFYLYVSIGVQYSYTTEKRWWEWARARDDSRGRSHGRSRHKGQVQDVRFKPKGVRDYNMSLLVQRSFAAFGGSCAPVPGVLPLAGEEHHLPHTNKRLTSYVLSISYSINMAAHVHCTTPHQLCSKYFTLRITKLD